MKKLTKSLLFLLPLATVSPNRAQGEEVLASGGVYFQEASELTQGLTFQHGGFIATHQLDNGSEPTTTSLGYPDDSHLPPSGPLLDAYNAAMAAGGETPPWYAGGGLDYFMGLSPLEQASLYRALGEDALVNQPSGFNLLTILTEWNALGPMLAALPAGEAGPALNNVEYFNTEDFSGVNLDGWNPEGLVLGGINFSGSNVTAEQLNAATSINGANLSGLDLTGLNTEGKNLEGINFVGSNISVSQLNAASSIAFANLSGFQTLDGLDTAEKDLAYVNFSGSNITPAQLSEASNIAYVNLSGTGITRAQLETLGSPLWGWNVVATLNTVTFE
jgi:hypothetical protein